MKLIKPSYEILTPIDNSFLREIEEFGRTCYLSCDKITPESNVSFSKKLIQSGHHSVIEHKGFTVKFIVDRGFMAEITRHRIASFSIESTRYVSYKTGCTFIIPPWVNIKEGVYQGGEEFGSDFKYEDRIWFTTCLYIEHEYIQLLKLGLSPQQARSVLPNSLKTTIIMTTNLRSWRNVFQLRTASGAHPQMKEIIKPLLEEVKTKIPIIFDDIL